MIRLERIFSNTVVQHNIKTKSVRAALFMGLGQGFDLILRFFSTIILARLLLPEYFGLVAMVAAVIGMVGVIKDLGLSTAIIQRETIDHILASNLFWINMLTGIILCIFISSISIFISNFFGDQRLTLITVVLSTNFVWSSLSIQHFALLSRQLKQGQISLIGISANTISTIVAIVLAIYGFEYWALVWREVIGNLVRTASVWVLLPWLPGFPKRKEGTKDLIRFGRNLSLTNLLTGIIAKLDGLLIGRFFEASMLGFYKQAYNLLVVPFEQINGPILHVAQPGLCRLQSHPDLYSKYYQRIVFLISLTTLPIGILGAIYAREIVLVILGEKWIGTIPFLRIFALFAALMPISRTYGIVLISYGKSTKYLIIALFHSIVLVIFMFLFIRWGAIGIAYAHLTTSVILIIPKMYYSYAGTPVTIGRFFRAIRTTFISGIITTIVLYNISKYIHITNIYQNLSFGLIVGITVYLTVIFLIPEGRSNIIKLFYDTMSSLKNENIVKQS